MRREVFEALCAAEIVTAPDAAFIARINNMGWRYTPPQRENVTEGELEGLEHPDVFFHETDALDYCGTCIVRKFCYDLPHANAVLKPYMIKYAEAVSAPGSRFPESAFEMMNDLPAGVMGRLRDFCEVRVDEPAWANLSDELPQMDRALCFILKGSVSVVQIFPVVDKPDGLHPDESFTFRTGKRLLKRYPPGHCAGIANFFQFHDQGEQVSHRHLRPKLIVSSHLGAPAEVWILRYEACDEIPGWKEMPNDLKGYLARMLCVLFADSAHHANIQER